MTISLNKILNKLTFSLMNTRALPHLSLGELPDGMLRDLNLPQDMVLRHQARHEANEWRNRMLR